MVRDLQHGLMAAVSLPIAGTGVWLWVERATSLLALGSALAGFIVGLFGIIWWSKRLGFTAGLKRMMKK